MSDWGLVIEGLGSSIQRAGDLLTHGRGQLGVDLSRATSEWPSKSWMLRMLDDYTCSYKFRVKTVEAYSAFSKKTDAIAGSAPL